MARWMKYVNERFPLPVYALLVGGIAVSGWLMSGLEFSSLPFVISFAGLMLFFFELRLMDEYKDYDKDVVANPDRPMPRGLLTTDEVHKVINLGLIAMLVWAGVAAYFVNTASGITFLAITVYLFLMYKEFFVGSWLEKKMLLYAITHQVILLGLCAFAYYAFTGELECTNELWAFGLAVLGSFFTYEVCRKLDPKADPILNTYIIKYGPQKSMMIVAGTSAVAMYGASLLGPAQVVLVPISLLVLCSMVIIFVKPEKFKAVEGLATLSLLLHLWCGGLVYLFGS